MTCKNCIYGDKDVCEFPFNMKNVENTCEKFKNKSCYIELPCKVGDTVYDVYEALNNGVNDIRELKVTEIHIHIDKRNKPWIIIGGYYFCTCDFGKTVFLTCEEAEKALKERVISE